MSTRPQKPTSHSPQSDPLPGATPLSTASRAELVLVSQGRAVGLLPSLPAPLQERLAEMASPDGTVLPAAVEGVPAVLAEYYEQMKATVDDTPGTP